MSNEERLLKVLLNPHISEKASRVQQIGQYSFKVAADADKLEIKKAVELMFKVNVEKVRVSNVRGKLKRFGRKDGWRKGWKKAFVSLPEGQSINLTKGES